MMWSNRLKYIAPACILAAVNSVSFSQIAVQPGAQGAGINPESMYGKESGQGVYVRDSAVALEKFAQAQRMERLKEWSKAADLYQEVLEKFGDRVVPSQVDKDNNIYQYTSVIAAVQQMMSRWPADGVEVYRTRYEAAAQAMLDSAKPDDRAAMQAILNRYFATDTAKVAGIRLIDLYFEAGEFSAAAWLGDLLIKQHPNLLVERPHVMYRRALALHMAGDDEKSKAVLNEITSKYGQETASVRGVDQKLVDSLTVELAQAAPRAMVIADSAWPMYGGSASHARLSTAAGRPGAKLYSVELTKPNFKGLQGEQVSQWRQIDQADKDRGSSLGVMPSIDHGEMFFQDGIRLSAISIESGQPLAGWMQTYPGDRKGQYQANNLKIPPRSQLQTVTLTDTSVLAIMGQTDRFAQIYGGGGAIGDGKLVCLDRATGKERWSAQGRNLPEEAGPLRGAELSGAPLVIDNNVYVVARSNKGQQFEDCFVICFDLDTGKYKWNCYIASANGASNQFDGDGPMASSDAAAQLAYSSGRLYVLTNLGALAAVDAYGGKIVWLSIYQRDQSATAAMANPWAARMNGGMTAGNVDKPWMNNPVFIDNGKVFILPADGKYLQIYDAGTGVEIKRMEPKHLSGSDQGGADSLIAVNGSRLLVTGQKSAMYVNWEKYNIDTFDKRRDPSIEWPRSFANSAIRGRAFVANERAFFPTQERMYVIALKGGKVQEEYPDYTKYPKGWQPDDPEGPGNIIVSDDHVIIAAHRRIDVYTNMDAARQKLDAELVKNPNSADPRLRYAEVMFVAGDTDTAMKKLDEAIDILGGRTNMAPGLGRDRVYNDCISFAAKLSRDIKDASSENVATVQQLYDRASDAAQNPQQQVNYRMLRAKLATTIKDYPVAVKLYQEVITIPDWRKVPVMDETAGAQAPAAVFSRRAIDALIRTAGPIPYAGFEQEAIQKFEAAKAGNQADALVDVATIYPNAKVAPQALLVAADMKDAANDHRGAVQLLRQLYLTYPNTPDKRRVLESLARNYMAIPNRSSVAIARLSEAVKMGDVPLTKPMPLPDGRVFDQGSLAQALAELKKARGQEIAKALPDFKLPIPHFTRTPEGKRKVLDPFLPESAESNIAGVQAIVLPARDFQRFDRIATFSPGPGLCIYAVGSNQALVKVPMPDVPGLAWTPNGPIAWSGTQTIQLRGDSSDTAWLFDLKNVPEVETIATAGGEDATDVKVDEPNPDAEIVIRPNVQGRLILRGNNRIQAVNGNLRQFAIQQPGNRGAETVMEVRPVGETALVTTTSGRIVALDLADGHLRWQARLGDRPGDRLVATEDFIAVLQREENTFTITVLDTFSGQMIGRKTFDDGSKMPVNLTLSPDGTLVYLLPDRIVLKNLYEPWSNPEQEIVDQKAASTGQQPYIGSVQPDHLQVVESRILVMADQNVSLRVFSLETGKAVRYTPVDGKKEIDLTFATANTQPAMPVSVRVVGSQVYLIGPQSMMAYNLDKTTRNWRMPPLGQNDRTAETYIGRNHFVLMADTGKKINAGKVAGYRLYAYARYGDETDPEESGVTTFIHLRTDPSGIIGWQAVEGGFYYLSADGKLHFLKGAGT